MTQQCGADCKRATRCTSAKCLFCAGIRPLLALLISLSIVIPSFPHEVLGQPPGPSQVDVETVYLFNFAKFVRWPSGHEGEPLLICIAADKLFADSASRTVAGEQIGTRPLAVRLVQRPEDLSDCGILFVGTSAKDRLETLLNASARQSTLTVSDLPGFLDKGGMINLLVLNKRVRFAINLESVEKSGLSLSSELLKVAVKVQGRVPGEASR